MARSLEIELPEKLQPLLQPRRLKVVHGGRGSAKSWSVARILAAKAAFRETRILAAREIQRSLRESVHQLFKDQIKLLDLGAYLRPLDTEIRGIKNDSLITYTGLQSHTAHTMKSFEGSDVCWIEEGQAMPRRSWQVLEPTIRKPGSEIWITANLELEEDFFTRELVRNPPTDAIVIEINYHDNPWFTDELESVRSTAYTRAEKTGEWDDYDNIWLGKARGKVSGSIYGTQMQMLRKLGRVGVVEPRPRLPMNAFVDLGSSVGNATAYWLHQHQGTQHLFLKFEQEEGRGLRWLWDQMEDFRKAHRLRWGVIHMPHDGAANLQHAELVSRVELMEQFAREDDVPCLVRPVPRVSSLGMAIEVTREKMMDAYFDQKGCEEGLRSLDHYCYKWLETEQRYTREPHHNWASNGADAFRQWSTGFEPEAAPIETRRTHQAEEYIRGAY